MDRQTCQNLSGFYKSELTGIFWKQLSAIWEGPLWQISVDCLQEDFTLLSALWVKSVDRVLFDLGSSFLFRALIVTFYSPLAHNSHQQILNKLSSLSFHLMMPKCVCMWAVYEFPIGPFVPIGRTLLYKPYCFCQLILIHLSKLVSTCIWTLQALYT